MGHDIAGEHSCACIGLRARRADIAGKVDVARGHGGVQAYQLVGRADGAGVGDVARARGGHNQRTRRRVRINLAVERDVAGRAVDQCYVGVQFNIVVVNLASTGRVHVATNVDRPVPALAFVVDDAQAQDAHVADKLGAALVVDVQRPGDAGDGASEGDHAARVGVRQRGIGQQRHTAVVGLVASGMNRPAQLNARRCAVDCQRVEPVICAQAIAADGAVERCHAGGRGDDQVARRRQAHHRAGDGHTRA